MRNSILPTLFALLVTTIFSATSGLAFEVDSMGSEADKPSGYADSRYNWKELLKGSKIATRYRIQENSEGRRTHDRLQYQVKLRLAVPLNGKTKLRAGAQTGGDNSTSGWDNTGLGEDDSDGQLRIRLRQLFVESQLTEQIKVEVGSLFTQPEKALSAVYSFDSDGAITALRGYYQLDSAPLGAQRIVVTAGELSPQDTIDLLDRNIVPEDYNFYQVYIQGKFEDISYSAEFNHVNDQEFLRTQIEKTLDEVFGQLSINLSVEGLWSLDSKELIGVSFISQQKVRLPKIGKVKTKLAYVRNTEEFENLSYPSQSFYSREEGSHLVGSVKKEFGRNKKQSLTLAGRYQIERADNEAPLPSGASREKVLRFEFVYQRKF